MPKTDIFSFLGTGISNILEGINTTGLKKTIKMDKGWKDLRNSIENRPHPELPDFPSLQPPSKTIQNNNILAFPELERVEPLLPHSSIPGNVEDIVNKIQLEHNRTFLNNIPNPEKSHIPVGIDPNEIARKHGFALDANGKIVSPSPKASSVAEKPNRLTLEQVEEGKRRSSDFLRQEEWRKKYGPTVEYGNEIEAQQMRERMETLSREKAEREAAERERLDQEAEDWDKLGEQPKSPVQEQPKTPQPTEEVPDWGAKVENDVDSYGEAAAAQQQIIDDYNRTKEKIRTIEDPAAKEFRRRLDSGKEQAKEQARVDSMAPEQQQAYYAEQGEKRQQQREADAATHAGQRKAARALEEEPGGISYIGAEGGKSLNGKDLNGYESVYFDKDDVVSMLTKKHGEAMGSKGAIKYMTDNIEKDLNKGFERIMSSNSKDKRKEVDELIGGLAARIDDGPGLGDLVMGNKLHTGAIGLAAMAGTMGVAFGGHKSNAELYSSPF